VPKSIHIFIIKLIAAVFFVFAVYFTDDKVIKTVALIILLVVINLESINQLWFKYKNKRDDNLKK
jgi:membrane protein YdbS with pleckstrin-like domain